MNTKEKQQILNYAKSPTKLGMNKDKYICGKLGICWHDYKLYPPGECGPQYGYCTNPNCHRDWYGKDRRVIEERRFIEDRHDFSDPAGTVMLLELMSKGEQWEPFAFHLYNLVLEKHDGYDPVKYFIVDYITIPGALRDAVYDYFKGRE